MNESTRVYPHSHSHQSGLPVALRPAPLLCAVLRSRFHRPCDRLLADLLKREPVAVPTPGERIFNKWDAKAEVN